MTTQDDIAQTGKVPQVFSNGTTYGLDRLERFPYQGPTYET